MSTSALRSSVRGPLLLVGVLSASWGCDREPTDLKPAEIRPIFDGAGDPGSHFRVGTLSWVPTGTPGEVRFRIVAGFRRDAPAYGFFPGGSDEFAETGEIITENQGGTGFFFGDGSATPTLRFVI